MSAVKMATAEHDIRWLISAPCADESLRSVLGRAASLYGEPPDTLWAQLLDEADLNPCSIDDPSIDALAALARILAVKPGRVTRLVLPGTMPWLVHGQRHPYCPGCWRMDDAAGRPRHFRRAWARTLSLHCEVHGTPLVAWRASGRQWAPARSEDLSLQELLIGTIAGQPQVDGALGLIHAFADRLAASLDGQLAWPSHWNDTEHQALENLIQVMTPDGPAESSWLSQTYTSPALRPFIHPGPNKPEAGASDGWESLRRTGDPATRRMALWLVGGWVVPSWPDWLRAPLPRP